MADAQGYVRTADVGASNNHPLMVTYTPYDTDWDKMTGNIA